MVIVDTPGPLGDTRQALAELVAHPTDPHPRRLTPDNHNAGRLPSIARAVGTGAAYMVNTAPDVLAWDVDSTELRAAALDLANDLEARGWPVLCVESGRLDHLHLWAVIPGRADQAAALELADRRGLPVRNGPMRPPGTPHRQGLPVRLLGDPDAFADAVEATRGAVVAASTSTDRSRYDWRDILRTGHLPASLTCPAHVGPGWWRVFWVNVGAIREGLTLDDLRTELADPRNLGGAGYRRRLDRKGKSHADYWLEVYVWPKATTAAAQRPRIPADDAEARQLLDALEAAVHACNGWAGLAGATDRAVILALIDRARTRGTLTPTMSTREIAEAVGCNRNTASRSAKRLIAAGWLYVAERGRGATVTTADGERQERANATRWRLRPPTGERARLVATVGTPPARTSLSGSKSRARLDVCRWRGVGLNAPRVLDALTESGPMAPRELAEVLNLNLGNLRARLLPKLADLGLLVRCGSAYGLPDDLDAALVAAADELELTGKADAVKAEHADQRAGYLEHRERTRAKRDAARRRSIRGKATSNGTTPAPTPETTGVEPVATVATLAPGGDPPDRLDVAPMAGSACHAA